MLSDLGSSLLVRTDFDDGAWRAAADAALRENHDGFRASAEPVSDPDFDGADWQTVRAAVPANDRGASVLFIADRTALTSAGHPVLVVDLLPDSQRQPFRCIAAELWNVDNNLNLANMDWEDFARAADPDGIFRGFTR